MVLNGEERLEYKVSIDGIRVEHASEFKYLGFVLYESGTDEADCHRNLVSGRRVAGAITSLVNARGLQLECVRVMHETLLLSVAMYCSKTILWKEKKKSRIRAAQIDNLRGFLRIRRIDKISIARIRWSVEACRRRGQSQCR